MKTENFSEIFQYISDSSIKTEQDPKILLEKLEELKSKNKIVSDVYTVDEDGNRLQYIQLVQEGGGTLGISLVGFCFVLEYIGVRFLKLAGTSAGAINTLFMASLGKNKNCLTTPELFSIVRKMDMFSFVDGHWIAKKTIKSFISKDGWISKILAFIIFVIVFLMFLYPIISMFTVLGFVVYFIGLGLFLLIAGVVFFLLKRFKKAKFGINPGNTFLSFLFEHLREKDIVNKLQLDRVAKFNIEEDGTVEGNTAYKFHERAENTEENKKIMDDLNEEYHVNRQYQFTLKDLTADYTFIAVDIASERKIEFPAQAGLYWINPNVDVNPAVFVRASMAIPLFFEPVITQITYTDEKIINNWSKIFVDKKDIPNQGIFVDGGSISNFPISIFHNEKIIVPRVPVFGIRINDAVQNPDVEIKTFFNYAGKIINTMKSNYDKDFLTKNNFYEKFAIADINTFETKANWLDFNMNDENKKELFLKGMDAAIRFLEKFDWLDYKRNRAKVYFENNQ